MKERGQMSEAGGRRRMRNGLQSMLQHVFYGACSIFE